MGKHKTLANATPQHGHSNVSGYLSLIVVCSQRKWHPQLLLPFFAEDLYVLWPPLCTLLPTNGSTIPLVHSNVCPIYCRTLHLFPVFFWFCFLAYVWGVSIIFYTIQCNSFDVYYCTIFYAFCTLFRFSSVQFIKSFQFDRFLPSGVIVRDSYLKSKIIPHTHTPARFSRLYALTNPNTKTDLRVRGWFVYRGENCGFLLRIGQRINLTYQSQYIA